MATRHQSCLIEVVTSWCASVDPHGHSKHFSSSSLCCLWNRSHMRCSVNPQNVPKLSVTRLDGCSGSWASSTPPPSAPDHVVSVVPVAVCLGREDRTETQLRARKRDTVRSSRESSENSFHCVLVFESHCSNFVTSSNALWATYLEANKLLSLRAQTEAGLGSHSRLTGAHGAAERMGRRDSRGAMTTSDRSELGCLQDAASTGNDVGDEPLRLVGSHRPCGAERRRGDRDAEPVGREAATAAAPMEVKKHQHKHNLKHRYEVMETLGKGTYGKVKRAVERASLKTVSGDVFKWDLLHVVNLNTTQSGGQMDE